MHEVYGCAKHFLMDVVGGDLRRCISYAKVLSKASTTDILRQLI